MDALFLFIEQMCQKYNIDESHGIKHAKGTMLRAKEILSTLIDVTAAEEQMALYSAALHDMCDHKYTDVERSSKEIHTWLLGQGWNPEDAVALIKIITSMSYSKLKNSFASGETFPDHGPWQRAYHVARHADLLEGYIVARCVLYNKHIHPTKSDEEHWLRAEELFKTRVFKYISDGWIFLPGALEQVKDLEEEARRCLEERSLDWAEFTF
jgi:hypothetical protein